MDQFMSGHDIAEPQLYLVSLCSLMLASKMCDKEMLIPRLSTLCQHLPCALAHRHDFRRPGQTRVSLKTPSLHFR